MTPEEEKRERKRQYARQYRLKNRDKILEYERNHRDRHREDYNAYMREWQRKHPEQNRARVRAWELANPERVRERNRQWRARNPEKIKDKKLRELYGITLAEVNAMIEAQGGGCLLCGGTRKLSVDHDHETGEVRGILCDDCNNAIGRMKDSPFLLRKAARYVEDAKCPPEQRPGFTSY